MNKNAVRKSKDANESATSPPANDSFLQALSKLETTLETPVVPGELDSWIDAVNESTNALVCLMDEQLCEIHSQQFSQMAKVDDELLGHIENLHTEDEQIISDLGDFHNAVLQLWAASSGDEGDETDLETVQAKLVEAGLAFVIRARTQETAIATRYSEAFLRNRGVGD